MNDKQIEITEKEFPNTFKALRRILNSTGTSEEEIQVDDRRGERNDGNRFFKTSTGDDTNGKIIDKNRKRSSRSRRKLPSSRRDRSFDQVGSRRGHTSGGQMVPRWTGKSIGFSGNSVLTDSQSLKRSLQLRKQLRQTREEYIGVTRRTGYMKPMEMFSPTLQNNGNDGVIMTGSEFLSFITVQTTSSTQTPTEAGDTLILRPINPLLLPGTRIKQYAELFQKYCFLDLTVEFVPSISSLQNGSLILMFQYDPTVNYTVTTSDPEELMRLALSHVGANLFNVYDYGRTVLVKFKDSLNSYYIQDGTNSRQEMQAIFLCLAASNFVNDEPELNLGSLFMHYHVRFDERALIEAESNAQSFTWSPSVLTNTLTFSTTGVDTTVALKVAGFPSIPVFRKEFIYVMRCSDTLTSPSTYTVYDSHGDYRLFNKGSIWFGRVVNDSSSAVMFLYSTLEDAMENETDDGPVRWRIAPTGADVITAGFCTVLALPIHA